jgi:hypothetical protein
MSATIETPGGIKVLNQIPEISKYFNKAGRPYINTQQVINELPIGVRHEGLVVRIVDVEYHFHPGILDSDLKVKIVGSDQNNFSRLIKINSDVLSGVGTIEQQICDYINNLQIVKTDVESDIWIDVQTTPSLIKWIGSEVECEKLNSF